ncbi:tetrapyrrole biosynthesis uroporphyrinogen III synthase [Leucogyrophana mollusca]|uniref:Tetrapyrrole biosynthesis uroporphyrinogen III synthase n=1 Tax=Leucogyrophana mollusca TaxID=85980 RepID=A0ACB8BGR6_9AGAM|nr:tetrapyrrole biosynthesis uroporphyrinogen III synthase [Leucogyrophana mollusca]
MSNVLLLRAPSQGSSDHYESSLRSRGYNPLSVSVLETVIVQLAELARRIRIGPKEQAYAGVIVTSKRAVEAWSSAIQEILSTSQEQDLVDWASVPFYVVGETTASALHDIRTTYDSPWAPKDIRGGAESGTAESLARFIIRDLDPPIGNGQHNRLFYLTGDKNRDTLPSLLEQGGIDLEPLQVYATRGSSRFAKDLADVLHPTPLCSDSQEAWGWIVFFAPSAAEFVTPTLRSSFILPMAAESPPIRPTPNVKIAAIGPTTAAFLRETLSFAVAVVASKPNAEDLASAIMRHGEE